MTRGIAAIALGAVLATAACGGASAAPDPATAPRTAAVATLPPAATPAAATLPPAATPAATPSATSAAAGTLALGKKVYETAGEVGCTQCHGPRGSGGKTTTGETAPDIRGASPVKVREALAGSAALMTFIKLSEDEIDAVVVYLQYLNDQP